MSVVQIPNLGAAIALNGTEQFEAVQAGVSVRVTTAQLGAYTQANYALPLSIGVTAISGGTSGRVLYDNAGKVDEYTTTGTAGSVVLSVSPTFTGNVAIGTAALATTATDGFLYIPTCPGAPTGVPTSKTGLGPLVYDSTNNKLYFYNGGWKAATFT